MKKILLFLLGLITLGSCSTNNDELLISIKSDKSLDVTINQIKENALHLGWSVTAIRDMKQKLQNKVNRDIGGEVKIIELCKPEYAAEILSIDDNKYLSVLMPCSISVIENKDKAVFITYLNIPKFSEGLTDETQDILRKIYTDQQELLQL
ncbi:DUF302 domain-containing protein [Flammeovirga pectinis]|uniref:DUF302 domain-containing protein n=1 Tax=Flammeovirga pectinis TaxID=2494373 RepID=A0A3Q9FV95_9BACT|nr:DUF302 domain-containing protein [Flammeovirga pectinis]AZQ65354.1 DUF302 domain-containing protein [Flammeovirga pectinis]